MVKADPEKKVKPRGKKTGLLTIKVIPEHIRPVLDGADELSAEQESEVCDFFLECESCFKRPGGTGGLSDVELIETNRWCLMGIVNTSFWGI